MNVEKTKDEVARELCEYHVGSDAGIVYVARVRVPNDDPREPIKLLEVNRDTVSAGVLPVHLGASRRTPYSVVLIELTPDEYRRYQSGELPLPEGWEDLEVLYDGWDANAAK